MNSDVTLTLATIEDAQLLHEMKYEAFLLLYEKCGFVRVGEEHVINEYMILVDYEKTVTK